MSFLTSIFMVLVVFLGLNSANAGDPKIDIQKKNEYLAKYFNTFSSFDELIENMQFFGILDAEDRQEILLRLKEMGVDAKAKLPLVKAEGNRIRFGKSAVLVSDADGKIKTGDGHFIKISKGARIADIFMQVVNLQTGKKAASRQSLFFSPAWADIVDIYEVAESAIGTVVLGMGSFLTGDIIFPAAGVGFAFAGGVRESYLYMYRNWLVKGKVRCEGKDYVASGFEDRASPLDLWKGSKGNGRFCLGERNQNIDKIVMGHTEILCKVTLAGFNFFDNSFEDRNKNFYVKEAVLKKELGEPIPPCTKELASKLNDKMKMRFRAAIDAVKQKKSSELIKSSPNTPDFEGVN